HDTPAAKTNTPPPHCRLTTTANALPSHLFFFNDTATTEIYTLSLHDALPIYSEGDVSPDCSQQAQERGRGIIRSEEHTSELQSLTNIVCRLLLEKKNKA